jgi:hypothetical protein
MNKRSSPDAEVKQQHTLVSSKLDATTDVADPFIHLSNLRFNGNFEI